MIIVLPLAIAFTDLVLLGCGPNTRNESPFGVAVLANGVAIFLLAILFCFLLLLFWFWPIALVVIAPLLTARGMLLRAIRDVRGATLGI